MKLHYNRYYLFALIFLFSIALVSCGEDSDSVSITKSINDKSTVPYKPKRSLPEKKKIEFQLVEKDHPLQINGNYLQTWFQEIRNTEEFRNEMEIDSNSVISYEFSDKLYKDLNGDGIKDVVLLIKKNIQDKKSFIRMYLFAFNDGEKLIPIEYFFGGSFESELLFEFRQITDSLTIVGDLIPNHFVKSKDKFHIEYYFDGKEFIRK